jgi:subtilase family serine protease
MNARRRRDFRPTLDGLDDRILLSVTPLAPSQIRRAYSENIVFNVNGRSYTANGAGQTIAIIVAGLDPYISKDLATFDSWYGIPAPPSFQGVYFQGAQNHESAGWIGETALDVEWAHAIAPAANILLVQAASENPSDYLNAIKWARNQPGVSVVSMSYGEPESVAYGVNNSIFTTPAGHTGVTFVAASGDTGARDNGSPSRVGVEWPAAVPTVLSVGGTTLSVSSNGTYLGESAWSGSGGGFSRVFAEPSYQYGVQRTGVRTVPDVSYDADPHSGVWVYNTLGGGWQVVGGTSAAAPQWAGLIAEVNQGRALAGLTPLDGASQTLPGIYSFSSAFRDITSGSNGYSATRGYDVVTGLGTPIGYVLAGDLAFHITSNYCITNALVSPASPRPSVGGPSSIGVAPLLAVADASWEAGPAFRPTGGSIDAAGSRRDSLLIALPPTAPPSPFGTGGHRHDRHDFALGSLVDEDLEFLRM